MTDRSIVGNTQSNTLNFAVLPIREVLLYPGIMTSLYIGRPASVAAVEYAYQSHQPLVLLAQHEPDVEEPQATDLHTVGLTVNIMELFSLPDGTLKIIVEGLQRVLLQSMLQTDPFFFAEVSILSAANHQDHAHDERVRCCQQLLDKLLELGCESVTEQHVSHCRSLVNPAVLVDTVASYRLFDEAQQQSLLESVDLTERFDLLLELLYAKVDRIGLEKKIKERLKEKIEQSQREYYLSHQMQVIQDELNGGEDLAKLEEQIKSKGMPEAVQEKALNELGKLRAMPPISAESSVIKQYLECLLELPWNERCAVKHDLRAAKGILDADHDGLDKVKERIVEFLAVQRRRDSMAGPVLCLVGPPGVGKTSLGQSIAAATGRPFMRISLGGVRDEAEIRGHRRTYIGSMPGKIIKKMAAAGVKNPVIMLDEIDKMSSDYRGDPASAMLEVLDAEQNHQFDDHYLEVGFDLSEVMFIATANTLDMPSPLLDRMEIVRLSGYTEQEKVRIAKRHLLPKQLQKNAIKATELALSDAAILDMIRYYNRESGVRSLDRSLAKICRKVVASVELGGRTQKCQITARNLASYLGPRVYAPGEKQLTDKVGQVTGLAWTEMGGDLLQIEAVLMSGKGESVYTGSLGDVMQESIKTALSLVRSRATEYALPADFYYQHDIHIHVPEGATPKDGPSAGIAMCTAMLSVLLNKEIRADVAMTGEVTLRGEVLAIGGLKEKCLAALRGGISTVIIPKANEKDLVEFPSYLQKELTIKPVSNIAEVWAVAFAEPLSSVQPVMLPLHANRATACSVV